MQKSSNIIKYSLRHELEGLSPPSTCFPETGGQKTPLHPIQTSRRPGGSSQRRVRVIPAQVEDAATPTLRLGTVPRAVRQVG